MAKRAELERCPWCLGAPIYVDYHDREWGVPERDDVRLFEKIILDGFQSGLSWLIILRKRDNFRKAFGGFEPSRIARYNAKEVARLMNDAGIVRNRAKIEGAVRSAIAFEKLRDEGTSFSDLIWSFTDGRTKHNAWKTLKQLPAETDDSRAMAKELKRRGFAFCGPTVCYAFMQAIGMVNDHLTSCYRYRQLKRA
jgi:DNA-3-methyladenine glycosylase I